MQPIDADALKDDLRESYNELRKIYDRLTHEEDRMMCGAQLSTFLEVLMRIKEAPTLDVVPVVRCKDCKESEECRARVGDDYCYCNVWDTVVRCNGFCDHGVKMDGDERD